MSELDKRKKLLIAESEVYRQTLKLEIQNLKIYGIRTRQKFKSFRTYSSLLALALPMIRGARSRKGPVSRFKRFGTLALLGWRVYSQFGGLLGGLNGSVRRRARSMDRETERRFERF